MALSSELIKLKDSDPDVKRIMDTFKQADQAHNEALIAMGQKIIVEPGLVMSTQVTIHVNSDLTSQDFDFQIETYE